MKKWNKQTVVAADIAPTADDEAYNALVTEMKNTPAYKELASKCAAHGYRLGEAYITTRGRIYVIIRPIDDHMSPELYSQKSTSKLSTPMVGDIGFRIQTFSIGSLPTTEFQKYLAAQQKAYELAVWLEEWEGWGDLLVVED